MKIALYKGRPEGVRGIYNVLVCWWTRSKHSHAELVFSNGLAASSSFMDNGVRFKSINFDPAKWDLIDVDGDEEAAYRWFKEHAGQKYDVLGNVGFVIGTVEDSRDKWSCAESVAEALGFCESWRFSPALLAAAVRSRSRM